MVLRIQKIGGPIGGKVWNRDDIKEGLERFYNDHGKYPTAAEIDSSQYLPSSRTIQRSFGGLVAFRKNIKLSGQSDFRSGEHSRERAATISKRAHLMEAKVYKYLQEAFSKEFVHREYFFTDDKRTRADFFVYDADKGFCVDVFYPNSRQNLIGCLNSKLDKYIDKYMRQYPVIYLQMNDEIEQDVLDDVIKSKKRKLPQGQYLMTWNTFQKFCKSKKAHI
jgi:hypothetical protein